MNINPNTFHRIFLSENAKKHREKRRKYGNHQHKPETGPAGPNKSECSFKNAHTVIQVVLNKAELCFQGQNTNNREPKHGRWKLPANRAHVV